MANRATEDFWCILRTAGRHTMSLTASLTRDGYEAWTPIETRNIRVPRMNARRTVMLPIMPRYIFARAIHLVDLLQLASMPVKPRRGKGLREPAHADFSVLHAFGKIPLVADRHLTELRKLEAKLTPIKRAEYAFPKNSVCRVKNGIFGGMVGNVVRSTPKSTVLCFGKGFPAEIPTSLLSLDALWDQQVATSLAA